MTRFSARLCSTTMLGAVALSIVATIFAGPALAMEVSSAHSDANSSDRVRFGDFIREASRRFSISEIWMRRVMHQESGGIVRIASPRGAIGLMQVSLHRRLDWTPRSIGRC
jgi:soluble lytic murein transglycosylase-like protein